MSSPRGFNIKQIHLLINGYLRETEYHSTIQIPRSIHKLIKTFYPTFKIYAIGRNDNGQFGLGHRKPLTKFKRLQTFSQLITNINHIYCNKGRFIIKTMQNNLFASGTNIFGQCGLPLSQRRYTKFQQIKVPSNHTANIVSCGIFNRHSFISTINNNNYNIFSCGDNSSGQFGNKYKTNEYDRNTLELLENNALTFNIQLKKIVCSDQHSLFLCMDGRLYACGDNEYGTAGLGENISEILTPTHIIKGRHIMDIDCGMWHNICVDIQHNVWVFGANFFGQIGLENNGMNGGYLCFEPVINEFFKDKEIYRIECGSTHSLCMTLNGNIYLFGQSSLGQIGNGIQSEKNMVMNDSEDGVFMPYLLQCSDGFQDMNIVDASCGANHNVLLSMNNEVVTFGDNKYRQCSGVLFDKGIVVVKKPYVVDEIGISNKLVIEKVLAETNSTLIVVSVFKQRVC